MAIRKKPPRTSGAARSAVYTAMAGQERVCVECGVSKPINYKTFTPSRASPDGVNVTCRQCQGATARKAQLAAKAERIARGDPEPEPQAPDHPTGWPNPVTHRKAYWEAVREATDRLYALKDRASERRELAELCKELNKVTRLWDDPAGSGQQTDEELAFRTFAHVLSPLVANWTGFAEIHDADILPALLDKSADQVLILASRNSGKSTITEIFATWLLHRNAMDIIGVVSGGTKRAKRTLRTVRQFIENCPLLAPLRPDDTCLDSSDQFVTPAANGKLGSAVSFSSFGIASNMTGNRFNKAILDDLETKSDRTPLAQENLDYLTADIFNILNPGGRVVALGTPQVAGLSMYARWAKSPEWKLYKAMLFEELPADEGAAKQPVLRSRWPARWSDAELTKKRRTMPAREWDLHWRIDLTSLDADDRPLKLRDFITVKWDASRGDFPTLIQGGGERLTHLETGVADADDFFRGPLAVSKDAIRYVMTCAAVDPASGVEGRDEVGVAVVSVTSQGLAVIRCIAGVRGRSSSEALNNAASLVHSFLPTKLVVEARADSLYPAQLTATLAKRGYSIIADPVHSGGSKGTRILDAVGVPLAAGRVVMLESAVTGDDAQETIKQITHMTADARALKHDDRIDALAWALATVAPLLLVDEADNLVTASQAKLETLIGLPLRNGGIAEDSPEAAMFEVSEAEERLQHKLDRALELQQQELRDGKLDSRFAAYIATLTADLHRIRGRAVAPA